MGICIVHDQVCKYEYMYVFVHYHSGLLLQNTNIKFIGIDYRNFFFFFFSG